MRISGTCGGLEQIRDTKSIHYKILYYSIGMSANSVFILREGKLRAKGDFQEGRKWVRSNMYCFQDIPITKCSVLYSTMGTISNIGGVKHFLIMTMFFLAMKKTEARALPDTNDHARGRFISIRKRVILRS